MKNRDWLNKPEDHANRDDGDTKARKQRWEAFERVAADPGKYWREDGFDEIVSWERLSARGKVAYLSWCAANDGVPYDRFVKAVQHAVGEKGLAGGEGWSLQGLFEGKVNEWARRDQSLGANSGQEQVPAPTGPEPSLEPEMNQGREM